MKLKIREDDRHAVDVVLDRRSATAGKAPGVTYADTTAKLRDRVQVVEKVLSNLDHLAAADPARDLMSRTLTKVAKSSGRDVLAGHNRHAPSAQPVA